MQITSRAKVWIFTSDKTAWHFVTLSKASEEKLVKSSKKQRRGWGSIPVLVEIGKSSWKTSVFPNKSSGGFILPIKAKVRKAEEIENGDMISFTIEFDAFR